MEVDTGASVTVINEAMLGRIWLTQPAMPFHLTDVKLRAYTVEAIPVVGKLMVKVQAIPVLTVNTHMGLYRYLRLPFGVLSAPAIFQRTIETLLHVHIRSSYGQKY